MPILNPGKLQYRIVIQNPVEIQNQSTGAMVVEWDDLATVWADIVFMRGSGLVSGQAEHSKIIGRVIIRYRDDITSEMRIFHPSLGDYYNIEGVLSDPDSGLEYLTLPISEGIRYLNQPIGVVPTVLEYPVINGVPTVGNTLTATDGTWANEPESYEYQWYLDDLLIDGETGLTLVVPNQLGGIVTIGVKAINSAGESVEFFSDGVIISA